MEHRCGRLENSKRFNAALLVEKSALEELYFILGITYRHTKCLFTLYIQNERIRGGGVGVVAEWFTLVLTII
jgi:hypothetical protein